MAETIQPTGDVGEEPIDSQMDEDVQEKDALQANLAWKEHTLEYKRKVLAQFKEVDQFVVGSYIDAKDTEQNWCVAKIEQIKGPSVYVNFDGWGYKWQSWHKMYGYNVAAFRTWSMPYTGQQQTVAIRNKMDFSIEELREAQLKLDNLIAADLDGLSAWEVTQYFRGELLIYTDFVLGANDYQYSAEELEEVIFFLKTVLQCIVLYLRRLPSWEREFNEMVTDPNLYFVCPQHALIMAYAEFAEILRKFFGCCHRALRFFICYDKNQEPNQNLVVRDLTDEDFEKERIDQDDFEVKHGKDRVARMDLDFGQLFNFVQYFHEIGGFKALVHAITAGCTKGTGEEDAKKLMYLPLPLISAFLRSIFRLRNVLEENFAKEMVEQVRKVIVGRLTDMDENDVKQIDKDDISDVFFALHLFLQLSMSPKCAAQEIESAQMALSFRFLKSSNLEKRLKGLNDIRSMIEQVLQSAKEGLKKAVKEGKDPNPDNKWLGALEEEEEKPKLGWTNKQQKRKVEPAKFLTTGALRRYLMSNKVLEVVLGENSHPEIVKRCGPILIFIIKYGQGCFDESCVSIVWRCQEGKHEEMVRIVYALIQEISGHLNINLLNEFFERIRTVPQKMYDEKFLTFLKELTQKALTQTFLSQVNSIQNQMGENQGNIQQAWSLAMQELETRQIKAEHSVISDLKSHISTEADNEYLNMYGMPIFWSLCCDETGAVNQEVQEQALDSLKQLIFSESFRKMVRMPYLLKALKNLIEEKAVFASISLLKNIVEGYNTDAKREYAADIDDNDESEKQEDDMAVVLQKQLSIIDFLVNNCEQYNNTVKQKIKQLQDQGQAVPERVEDCQFVGKQKHSDAIQQILDFIEFLVLVSDNKVEIGIGNINKLWQMFVKEPNFDFDQITFLNWINKDRIREDKYQQKRWELNIFQTLEKEHLFLKILCDPDSEQDLSPSMARAFQRYFLQINAERQSLSVFHNQPEVFDFQGLLGADALWNYSMNTGNQRARETLSELLVDVHLRLSRDEDAFTQEQRQQIAVEFIKKCMQAQLASENKKGVVHLLGIFLDRYEGIKPLKAMHSMAARCNNIRDCQSVVYNRLDGAQPGHQENIPISYFQTIGCLRKKIAETFGLQINQFKLFFKQLESDPDLDDSYVKDFSQQMKMLSITTNHGYDPAQHPKYLIAGAQNYFNIIFSMLSAEQPELLLPVWELIERLPVNNLLLENMKEMTQVREAHQSGQGLTEAWSLMFDPHSVYKLLYCLRIVKDSFLPKQSEEGHQMDEDIQYQQKLLWKQQFVTLGGFDHLTLVFCHIDAPVYSTLGIQCVQSILEMILQDFDDDSLLLAQIQPELQRNLILKTLQFIKKICQVSLDQEEKRGISWEQIKNREREAAEKAKIMKSRISWNKQEEKDENQDGDSELKKLQPEFERQAKLVNHLFQFLESLIRVNRQLAVELVNYQELEKMLVQGCVRSENYILRETICRHVREFVSSNRAAAVCDVQDVQIRQALLQKVLSIQLFSALPVSQEPALQLRIVNFYTSLRDCLALVEDKDLKSILGRVNKLVTNLVVAIKTRDIVEKSTEDNDYLLTGYLQVLAQLLAPLPELKKQVGQDLLQYLIHDCLFETPKGMKREAKGAPKCKGKQSRHAALSLLAVLTRDFPEHLDHVLDYIRDFNSNPSWRSNKDMDWSISFASDAKSSTGYVGLKNLGCICYMNSLNQQLFMIPGFRNDILSIKQPNNANDKDEDNLFLQWQTLFSGLLLSEKMYVSPKAYCHSFKDWEGQPVNVLEQMDVEEYLNMFLDRLESAIKGTPQEKTIHYHFGGELANEIVGQTCPHKYERKEPMLSIGVTVKNKKSLDEGMQAFIQGDMLEADNAYQCEKCDKKVDALKRVCIRKLPRYLLMTLKRFDFDFDTMQRQKVNDYFEFPVDLEMSNYTQEYLSKKEAYDKAREEKLAQAGPGADEAEILEGLTQEALKFKKEYYQYELVGAVIHTGTADSGHYYSYIREQNDQSKPNNWYEFNDIWVHQFDPADIPDECFGGEESGWGGGMMGGSKKYMKFRNAYILVYRRKLDEDVQHSDDEEEEKVGDTPKLGLQELDLEKCTNPLLTSISSENHFYWQNRFLFGQEYNNFVKDMLDGWTTAFCIPAVHSFRNNDWDLMDPHFRGNQQNAKIQTIEMDERNDKKRDMSIYPEELMDQTLLKVFKFGMQFYLTIQIRSTDKLNLPILNRYLKAYINADVRCAQWLVKEFTNWALIKEMLLESAPEQHQNKFMKKIVSGLLYCAMCKLYQKEKDELMFMIEDLGEKPDDEVRYSVLGNFMWLLMNKLPTVYQSYSACQSQYLSLIAGFARQGAPARLFLHKVGCWSRISNMFFNQTSPGFKDFLNRPDLPTLITEQPEMGLATPQETQLTGWAAHKEEKRMEQLMKDKPQWKYIIETMGYLLASMVWQSDQEDLPQNPFMIENSGVSLQTQVEKLLFRPGAKHTQRIFTAAKKPRAYLPIIRGYMADACSKANPKSANYLFEVIEYAMINSDLDYTPQFFSLFEALLGCTHMPWHATEAPRWLSTFVQDIVQQNDGYYLWMEQTVDWIFKVTSQNEYVRKWFQANSSAWDHIYRWVQTNRDPPRGFQGKSSRMLLTKSTNFNLTNNQTSKLYRTAVMHYRIEQFKNLLNPPQYLVPASPDLFALDMHDFKWEVGAVLEFQEAPDKMILKKICFTLDEMVQCHDEDKVNGNRNWELTCSNKLMPHGTRDSQYRTGRIQAIYQDLVLKQEQQQKKQKAEVPVSRHQIQDDKESSEDYTVSVGTSEDVDMQHQDAE